MTEQQQSGEPVGYWQLVRENADFRYLWFGQIVSLLGDWFNVIAVASLLATLTDSGIAVGSLFAVRMLAPFLASPVAGVVADRCNRKHVLIAADLGRAVTVCGFLLVRDPSHVWLLYALSAVQLGISGFFFPARTAILPDVVSARALGTANALGSATWSAMLALGAAAGGLVSGAWGTTVALIVDVATFLVSALLIAQVRLTWQPASKTGGDRTFATAFREYTDGLRYLKSEAEIAVTVLQKPALVLCFGASMQVVMVAISQDVYRIGEAGSLGLGLMYGMAGVGTGLGPIVMRIFTKDEKTVLRRTLLLGYALAAVGLLVAGSLASFSVVLLGIVVRSVGGGILWVFSTQLLLQQVADEVRGRVFSTEHALFMLAGAAGAALGGQYLDSFGIAGSIKFMAAITLLPGMLWALWLLRGKWRQLTGPTA